MSKTEHFYLLRSACVDSGKNPALEAIEWAIRYLQKNKLTNTTIWCVFENKNQILSSEFSFAIDNTIGSGTAKKLAQGSNINLDNGNAFTCVYKTKYPTFPNGIVMNFWCSGNTLDLIDSWNELVAVITVTWDDESYTKWISTWAAKEILGNNLPLPNEVLHSAVEKALQTISKTVAKDSNVGHPNDVKACEDMFKILKFYSIPINSNLVKTYCLQNGWSPTGANKLKKYAEKINAKAVNKLNQRSWSEESYKKWFV